MALFAPNQRLAHPGSHRRLLEGRAGIPRPLELPETEIMNDYLYKFRIYERQGASEFAKVELLIIFLDKISAYYSHFFHNQK